MNFLDDVTYEEYHENINRTILDVNVTNTSVLIIEVNNVAIDNNDSLCHGYYITKFSSSPYTIQTNFSIDGKVISSGKIVCEGTYFFPINFNSNYYILLKKNPLKNYILKDNNQWQCKRYML